MRCVLPYVNRVGGALLIVVGLYVGYYGVYEVRLFHANGNPVDPLVNGVGRLQGTLVELGAPPRRWPWVWGIVVVLLGVWRSRGVAARDVREGAAMPSSNWRNSGTRPLLGVSRALHGREPLPTGRGTMGG